jgi:hypothetical protein
MIEGAVGTCNVLGIQVRVPVGGTVHALACYLGNGPNVGTHGSGMVGDRGRSTLGDGMSVAIELVVPWWRVERRISRSF